ncbi:MAG: serine/threonine protein kinase [Phycisphaerae bacterium]|nr:serine/threonine protein kinase [Phycisphaerae bacterium]
MGKSDEHVAGDLSRDARMGRALDEYLKRQRGGDSTDGPEALATATLTDGMRAAVDLVSGMQRPDQLVASLINRGVLAPATAPEYMAAFGEYAVVGLLGRGGMGIVLKAIDPRLGRAAALKILRPEFAGERTALERFEREARAAAAMQHPNIVTVYAVGEQGGAPFIAMEYVDGVDLAAFIRARGPLEADLARHIFRELIKGLSAAHERGLIHRDIKPSNVLLGDVGIVDAASEAVLAGRQEAVRADKLPAHGSSHCGGAALPAVRLADFGLARIWSSQTQLTTTGAVLGTPDYMSPEQARGDGQVDHSTDLYSAGVVLYEMLTGRTPFKADTPTATLRKIIDEEPPDPRRISRDIDRSLSALAIRMMAKAPQDRPVNAEAVLRIVDSDRPIRYPRSEATNNRWIAPVLGMLVAIGSAIAWFVVPGGPSFDVADARVVDSRVEVRRRGESAYRELRDFHQLGDNPLVCADDVHTAAGHVVVVGLREPVNEEGDVLLGLDADGNDVWHTPLHHGIPWPEFRSSARWWHVRQIVVADIDQQAGDELIVVAQDANDSPTRISMVDPLTGNIQGTFWHFGHIYGLLPIPSLLDDGRTGILAWGMYRLTYDGTYADSPDRIVPGDWELVPVAMVLDPTDFNAESPSMGRGISGLADQTPVAYAFLNKPGGFDWPFFGDARGQPVPNSKIAWKIDNIIDSPRQDEDGTRSLLQVSFHVKKAGADETIKTPFLKVTRQLEATGIDEARGVTERYDDSAQWLSWWRTVATH